jgi:hypothetical protein
MAVRAFRARHRFISRAGLPDGMVPDRVVEWLLQEEQPGVRYRTLTELLGRSRNDPEVEAARRRIPTTGWAADLLAERQPWGGWEAERNLYVPKYRATTWKMLALADLGIDRRCATFRPSIRIWSDRLTGPTGVFGANSSGNSHHCLAGNMTRAMIRFGYSDDPRIRATLEWLVRTASPLGGWSCFGSGRNLDSWEGLAAFAAYPSEQWTPEMRATVDRAAEFFLQRELHVQGAEYAPWQRFHHPVHYYYDLLVGLDLLTSLGHAKDPRLTFALDLLRKRRRRDGRWELGAVHPDVEGSMVEWYRRHPKDRPTPLALEVPGRPSKMITLSARKVLQRVDG